MVGLFLASVAVVGEKDKEFFLRMLLMIAYVLKLNGSIIHPATACMTSAIATNTKIKSLAD